MGCNSSSPVSSPEESKKPQMTETELEAKKQEALKAIQESAAIFMQATETQNDPTKPMTEAEKTAMHSLAASVKTPEGKSELKALFEKLDTYGDGKVSSKEWGHAVFTNKDLLSKYFGGQTINEIGKQFRRLDLDQSNYLTWDEFESGVISLSGALNVAGAMQTEEGKAELKTLFDTLDKDGNSKVSSKEWGQALKANQEMLAKFFGGAELPEIGKAFKRLDVDGSGDLTWEEFVNGAAAPMISGANGGPASAMPKWTGPKSQVAAAPAAATASDDNQKV